MSILSSHGLSVHAPFTDALDLTFPADKADEVESIIRPYMLQVFARMELPGLWRVPRVSAGEGDTPASAPKSKRKEPTCRIKRSFKVVMVGFSGGACDTLRMMGLWPSLLCDLAQLEHRVTRIHATVDLPGVDGPQAIAAVTASARAGGLHLGRKALDPRDVKVYSELDVRGALAGGVYLGSKTADIKALIYCKRNETESVGLPDPWPLTRVELRLSLDGITLRDAAEPAALFWAYGAALVTPPEGAPQWLAGDTGFMLEKRAEADVWAVLKRRVEDWHDLLQLGELADRLGRYGRTMLGRLICEKLGLTAELWPAPRAA